MGFLNDELHYLAIYEAPEYRKERRAYWKVHLSVASETWNFHIDVAGITCTENLRAVHRPN